MAKRVRRSFEEVVSMAMAFTTKGPFTSSELAAHLTVTPNRARQVLDHLSKEGRVAELGRRKSARGKPATLWGAPGTALTEADQEPRTATRTRANGSKRRGKARAVPAAPAARGPDPAAAQLAALLDHVAEHGLRIAGPGGLELVVTLGGPKPRRRKAGGAKRGPGRPRGSKAKPTAAASAAPAGAAKKKAAKKKAAKKAPATRRKKAAAAARKPAAKKAARKKAAKAPRKAAAAKKAAKKPETPKAAA